MRAKTTRPFMENIDAEDAQLSKDASEISNVVAGASHDKDNTTENECISPGDDTDAERERKTKERCMVHFRILYTLLDDLSKEYFTHTCFSSGFKRAFSSLFGEDAEYFAPRLLFNMDKLENQLNEEEFNEEISMIVSKPINEVQSTTAYNVFANDRQHTEQPEFINKGWVDQHVEQRLDKRPLLAFLIENKTTESLNQTLKSENNCLKKTIA
ncbi:hypothetical protein Tco_0768208 [Tanacetum coccineum]